MARPKKAQPAPAKKGRKAKVAEPVIEPVAASSLNLRTYLPTSMPRVERRTALLAVIALLVLALGYLGYKWLVIAWVDGKPVTRVALYRQLESRYGNDLKEQMIAETLIADEARRRGVEVSAEELDSEYQKFVDQFGGAENIDATLQAQGIDKEEFRNQIRLQSLIKKMFSSEATVSAEEVEKYIADNQEQYAEATDAAQVNKEVTDQLSQQKLSQSFRVWLQEAQASNRVIRL